MKPSRHHGNAGFTLIELMAVITIIVILAGLVVGGMGFVIERQAKEKAKIQIALLSKAIEEYKLDMGRYPGDLDDTAADGKNVSAQLYSDLFYEGFEYSNEPDPPDRWEKKLGNVRVPKATRIYLPELDPTSSKQGWVASVPAGPPPASTAILDPWGVEYRYRKGMDAQNPDFDLWSCGKDGKSNTSDPSMKSADNKDDIRNF